MNQVLAGKFYGWTALVGLGLLIVDVLKSILVRHTTLGSTPLDERSSPRRDHYPTTHNTHKRQTSMPPSGIEPRSQQASDRKPMPWTSLPLGSANYICTLSNSFFFTLSKPSRCVVNTVTLVVKTPKYLSLHCMCHTKAFV